MGESKNRIEREGQIWNVFMDFSERYQLRLHLLGVVLKDEDGMDKNNRAIEALEGDDDFEPPKTDNTETVEAWTKDLNVRLNEGMERPVILTIENVKAIRSGISSLAAAGKINGVSAYRLRKVLRRLKDAEAGETRPSKVERVDPLLLESVS